MSRSSSVPSQQPPDSSSPPPDEMDLLMRSSPFPPSDDEGPAAIQGDGDTAHDVDNQTLACEGAPVAAAERDATLQLSGVSRNEQAVMRRIAEKLKLHPYQRNAVQDFVKCSAGSRDGQLMMSIMAVDNKLDQLVGSAPPFSVTGPLHLNIKSFITAVLLSSKLAAYKGSIPRDHVLALIMRDRIHLPNNFERDPHAAKLLKEHVNHELSQARGKFKKLIKAGNEKNIFDLASALVNGTSCSITIPLCGRVALFRKMYKVEPGEDFWKVVDEELKKIRKKAADNPVKINRYFTAILKVDQEKYRGDSSTPYIIPTTVTPTDTWQLEVDSVIGDAAAVTA